MATYTDVQNLDVTQLRAGDIINYTSDTAYLNLTGFKFSCRLKGLSSDHVGTDAGNSGTTRVYGANCYAEFDFSSVSDGNVTIGSNYGSYIALTNGTGTDIRYNRIMVAGDAGKTSWYTSSGSTTYWHCGGNAGLFDASAGYGNGPRYYAICGGYPGTQTAGGSGGSGSGAYSQENGQAGSFGTGGARGYYSGGYGGGGGSGWYGGGGGSCQYSYNTRSGGGGGGSSYLLTSESQKPTGYLPEWQTYAPLISNSSSALLNADRDYYITITILEAPNLTRTFKYYNGTNWVECYANYYDGTQFKRCTIHRYDGTDWD